MHYAAGQIPGFEYWHFRLYNTFRVLPEKSQPNHTEPADDEIKQPKIWILIYKWHLKKIMKSLLLNPTL